MKISIVIVISFTLISLSQAEISNKSISILKSNYSNHVTGPTISVEGRQYQFLPEARSELSSRSVSTIQLPSLTDDGLTSDDGTQAFAPNSKQGTGKYLASKGRYDIYLEEQGNVNTFAADQASGVAGCGFCQVLHDNESGELALFTADISVRLVDNTREAAEQLAQDYGLSLKYYMGRMALAVYSAPDLASALEMKPLVEQDDGVRRARHSIVTQVYQPQ